MPFLLEHITEVVMGMMLVILACSGTLIALTIFRRRQREIYFQQVDNLRERFSPLIARLLEGAEDYGRGRAALDAIAGPDRVQALELLLLEKKPLPGHIPVLRRLCEDLGLVKVWQQELGAVGGGQESGRPLVRAARLPTFGFLVRARAAEKLGLIRHQPSWPLLASALNDPHPDVGTVAARSLAALGEPASFSALVDKLQSVVLGAGSRVSLRTIKMALVRFPLELSPGLLPSLQHSEAHLRFAAVDVLREMVERKAALVESFALGEPAFPAELQQLMVERLSQDECADVRARCAPIFAYFDCPAARASLFALLEDPQWFVRLHAVRAMAKRRFAERGALVARRLTDPQWRVREAAVRTLLAYGPVGLDYAYSHILATRDRYSKEQIADDLQRSGLIPALLSQYGKDGEAREARVLEEFAALGKTSYVLAILSGTTDYNLRRKFLLNFGSHSDPQIRAWVKAMAWRDLATERRGGIPGRSDAA